MAKSGISLQDLKDKFHLSEAQLDEEVSETHLTEVSKIIANHEILGPELGLTSEEMTAISLEKTMDVQRLTMLTKWKHKFAWKADYRTLIEAHLKCSRADRARDLCKLLTHRTSSEQPSARVPQSSPISIPALSHLHAAGTDVAQPGIGEHWLPSSAPNTSNDGGLVGKKFRSLTPPPVHTIPREEQTPGQIKNSLKVMTSAEIYTEKLKKGEESKMQSNEELRELLNKKDTNIVHFEHKITYLNKEVETLKTLLVKERQERELLQKLKRMNRGQPTPPAGNHYVVSRGIKYNIKRNCVGGNTYEVMILVSVGSEFPPGVQVQRRVRDQTLAEKAFQTYGHLPIIVPGLHEEAAADLMAIASMRLQDYSGDLVRLCQDVPEKQCSKTYYLNAIEEHIKQCQEPMVVLYYMGHSEEGTGNWCFKDGTISFQEIFVLYKRHYLGKPLIIHSDCCYSGNWTKECAKTLDSLDIPACGHKAREQGILIKVYASCQPDQEAAEPGYSVEGVMRDENGTLTVCNKQLSHQKPSVIDTTRLICGRGPDDLCRSEEVLKNWTWQQDIKDPVALF